MTSSRTLLTAAIVGLLGRSGTAQTIADHPRVQEAGAALEKWLDGQRSFHKIPGVTAAVVFDQQVSWQGAFCLTANSASG